MNPKFVASNVKLFNAKGKDCRVKVIRNSTAYSSKQPVPLIEGYFESSIFADAIAIIDLFLMPAENFLFGEYNPFTHDLKLVDLHNVSTADMSRRFEQIITPYWLASSAPEGCQCKEPANQRQCVVVREYG